MLPFSFGIQYLKRLQKLIDISYMILEGSTQRWAALALGLQAKNLIVISIYKTKKFLVVGLAQW